MSAGTAPSTPLATISNNCWSLGPGGGLYSLDTNPILGNVLFTSSTWHLPQAGSVLLNSASATPVLTTDIRGIARPQGVARDIGAYERQSTEPTTTSSTTTTYTTTTTLSHTSATTLSSLTTTTTYTYTTTTITRSISRTFDIINNISYDEISDDVLDVLDSDDSEESESRSTSIPIDLLVTEDTEFILEMLDPSDQSSECVLQVSSTVKYCMYKNILYSDSVNNTVLPQMEME